jgi:parallel beta-helix repeat protein
MNKPLAFMSYAHVDDADGRLTELRRFLSQETQIQSGDEFPIFQDRDNIRWGQNWRERIEESLDEVTFLIPIITPGFFKSQHCRNELQRFLDRERQLGRTDLVLPIYFVDTLLLNDEARRETDELAKAIHAHQYVDWRELRHEPFTDPEVRRKLAQLAAQISEALERVSEPPEETDEEESPTPPERQRSDTEAVHSRPQRSVSETEPGETTREPVAKTAPPTRTVNPLYRGDHTTITEAIEAAAPGERILVHPGLYEEGIVIDKPLEIIGQGNLEEIVVQARGETTLLFRTTMGRVSNLTLRQAGGEGDWFGVDVGQGRLELEACDISSDRLACVAIHGGAEPILRRNRIHDGEQGGVLVYDAGKGTLEGNDIFANALSGVEIREGADPTLRNNRIHDGERGGGIYIHSNGRGTLEDNDIIANAFSGVAILSGAEPTLRRNRIGNNGHAAVYVREGGGGIIEDNDLSDNTWGPWDVPDEVWPAVRHDRNKF